MPRLAVLMLLICAIAPASARATVLAGTATDPSGDSRGAGAQDLLGVAVRYDDATGALSMAAQTAGDVAAGPLTGYAFDLAEDSEPRAALVNPDYACATGVTASAGARSDADLGSWTVWTPALGALRTGTATVTRAADTVSVTTTGVPAPTTAGLVPSPGETGYACLRVRLLSSDWLTGVRDQPFKSYELDALDVPLYFTGHAPTDDSDRDGLANIGDACATVPGTGNGCVPIPPLVSLPELPWLDNHGTALVAVTSPSGGPYFRGADVQILLQAKRPSAKRFATVGRVEGAGPFGAAVSYRLPRKLRRPVLDVRALVTGGPADSASPTIRLRRP